MTQQQPRVGEVEGVMRRRLGGIGADELRAEPSLVRRPTRDRQRLLVDVDPHGPSSRTHRVGELEGHLPVSAAYVEARPAGAEAKA